MSRLQDDSHDLASPVNLGNGAKYYVQLCFLFQLCAQLGFCVATCMGSFIGFFFCAIFGLKDCDPNEFGSFCNYTENMSENKALAVFILLFIIASAAVSILIACCNCRHAGSFGVQMQRGGRPLVIVGGSQGVTYHGTSSTPMMTGSTYQYPPVVVGGNMQTPGVHPVNTSSAQYPVNTSGAQYPINTSGAQYPVNPQFAQGQAGGTNTSVQELQEQNRLLQEQIRLQQQQLQLQQQLQQQVGPGGMATPIDMAAPPSYDECVTDEAAMIRLQEHNLALQKQSQQQQLALEKKSPPPGSGLEPSAPPT